MGTTAPQHTQCPDSPYGYHGMDRTLTLTLATPQQPLFDGGVDLPTIASTPPTPPLATTTHSRYHLLRAGSPSDYDAATQAAILDVFATKAGLSSRRAPHSL